MGRCYGCSQENCGYGPCGCDCHDDVDKPRQSPPTPEAIDLQQRVVATHAQIESLQRELALAQEKLAKAIDIMTVCWQYVVQQRSNAPGISLRRVHQLLDDFLD